MAITVTALLACHNRRELTVACLTSLFRVSLPGLDLRVVMVDDGSTDGTREAVEALGRPVTILTGTGEWFWSRSMAEAERVAERDDPDWVLWLNDDVEVSPHGLMQLLAATGAHPDGILVGPLTAPTKPDEVQFSGFWWVGGKTILTMRIAGATGEFQEVDGFHGNFVAVPRSARRSIGPIDGAWPHNFADLDYSRRARAAGVRILAMPYPVGMCHLDVKAYNDRDASGWARLRAVLSRRGWPARAQLRYMLRHPDARSVRGFFRLYVGAWKRRPEKTAKPETAAVT